MSGFHARDGSITIQAQVEHVRFAWAVAAGVFSLHPRSESLLVLDFTVHILVIIVTLVISSLHTFALVEIEAGSRTHLPRPADHIMLPDPQGYFRAERLGFERSPVRA
jgi:hypothetical protein